MARKQKQVEEADEGPDLLGKPIAKYGTGPKALTFIIIAVVIGLIGGGLIGGGDEISFALNENPDGTLYRFMGWVLVVLGMLSVAYGVFHLGQRLEIRRQGLRYTRRRKTIQLRWDEVFDIEIFQTHIYYRGVKQRTDWEIYISGYTGKIHLTKSFLHLIRSIPAVIGLLKHHSGHDPRMAEPEIWNNN
jgi:hypothetical protein